MNNEQSNSLKIRDLGIDTHREKIIFVRADSHLCRSEGFTAMTRLVVHKNNQKIVATLTVITSDLLQEGEAGLSLEAMKQLQARQGDIITISHLKPILSLSKVRAKMYHRELSEQDFHDIIKDIVAGLYSNMEIAAFVTACAGSSLTVNEIIALTRAMLSTGKKIVWKEPMILDKHCVGGLPGNRTTPIVVSIVAAAGLTIPKTSSRAITSPAGTADTMETITRVNLSIAELQDVIEKEGGCFAWGGEMKISPADDLLIAVEKALEVDSEGQLVASVLSKKAAAGATHVVIDIPVGPSAKVRSQEEALRLQYYFQVVSDAIGIKTEIVISDGTQPVGRGIGPALEAMDVLSVLRNDFDAPADLKERAIILAGVLLKMTGKYPSGTEETIARTFLENGDAYKKFIAICQAQGSYKTPVYAPFSYEMSATNTGTVYFIDNRKLARIAKLAGAPKSPKAGVLFFSPLGKSVKKGDTLFKIYADSEGELRYAKEYLDTLTNLIEIR